MEAVASIERHARSAVYSAAERFAADGYVALESFLSASDVAVVGELVEAQLRAPREASCVRAHNTLLPLRWDHGIVQLSLRSDRRVREIGDVVSADDLRWISGYVSVKDARSRPLPWHRDWWCWDHAVSYRPATPQLALLCYLGDTDTRSGALRALPCSHHRSAHLPEQVSFPVRAGDAVVIDYRLLHGTHANTTAARRDCLLLSFTPSWRELPADIRGHLMRHPALPGDHERPPSAAWARRLLPRYDGPRRDLPVNRVAPQDFAIIQAADRFARSGWAPRPSGLRARSRVAAVAGPIARPGHGAVGARSRQPRSQPHQMLGADHPPTPQQVAHR